MQIFLLKSKLLRAEVTDKSLHYEGSLAIDSNLMEAINLKTYEKILIGNISNGERFETYAIEAPKGSGTIALNGAAAHKGEIGDKLVIMSFAQVEESESADWKPKVLVLSNKNTKISKSRNSLISEMLSM